MSEEPLYEKTEALIKVLTNWNRYRIYGVFL